MAPIGERRNNTFSDNFMAQILACLFHRVCDLLRRLGVEAFLDTTNRSVHFVANDLDSFHEAVELFVRDILVSLG